MKKLSQSQMVGQRGELRVAERTLSMGFVFDGRNRLETGIDGFLELRDPMTGQTLARWIGAQVKTTEKDRYSYEDEKSFEYLIAPEDLAYWKGANVPVILVLCRLSDDKMYWKHIGDSSLTEPRRLRFDKASDRFDKDAGDRIAALCIDCDRLGSYVPPMRTGEATHLTMLRVILPGKIYVGTCLYKSGREASKELVSLGSHTSFDWVVRGRQFLSFRDPRDTPLERILDEGSIEAVETETVSLDDDPDDEYLFIDLLSRTLSVQTDEQLTYDRDSRSLYFRATGVNRGRKYKYRSLVNETSAEVVAVWRNKEKHVGSVRHHAFVPRFQRIGDEWLLSVAPTFIFTRDGYRHHPNAGALISGKKRKEKNGAVRGQFMMWRHLLIESSRGPGESLFDSAKRSPLLGFEALEPVEMPSAVPEDAWRREDPNAADMADSEWLL